MSLCQYIMNKFTNSVIFCLTFPIRILAIIWTTDQFFPVAERWYYTILIFASKNSLDLLILVLLLQPSQINRTSTYSHTTGIYRIINFFIWWIWWVSWIIVSILITSFRLKSYNCNVFNIIKFHLPC